MSNSLAPRLLDQDTIDRAYPLVRHIASGITLDRWGRFARPFVSTRTSPWPRGLMTIQNEAHCILALFGFEVRDDLQEHRTLCVENIIVASIPGRDAIWAAMVDAAEQLAKLHGCRAIRAGLIDELDADDTDRRWLLNSFKSAGYALEGIRACKRLERQSVANDH